MFRSHNNDNNDQATKINKDWSVDSFIIEGDAIYDYTRIPVWNCFDEQPTVYQYGDTSVGQKNSSKNEGSDVSKLAS